MDKDAIINTAPIIKGGLVDREREIKEKIVFSAINNHDISEIVDAESVARSIRTKMNMQLQPSVVENGLKKLESDGRVKHISNGKYKIIARHDNTEFDELYEPVWDEFRDLIQESKYDPEIDYTLDNYQKGLREVFFTYYRQSIKDTTSLNEYSTDSLSDNSLSKSINKTIANISLRNEQIFEELVKEYIQEESERLIEFFGTIYIGIVNQDLLTRAQGLDLSAEDDGNKILFLDTNAIIPLVCDSDSLYPLMENVCKRSRELGYNLYYLPATADEMDRVVRKTQENISKFKENGSGDPFNNQFINDYRRRNDISSPSAYKAHIRNWRKILNNHKIREYDNHLELAEKDQEVVENWVKELDRIGSTGDKSIEQIKHDAQIILSAIALRDESTGPRIGPFGISNNTSLLPINNIGKGKKWEHGVLIDPQGWLNYLVTFTPAEFVEGDENEIARVILSTAADFDDNYTLDDYMDLLAAKSGVPTEDSGHLKDMIMETPLAEELENAARTGDGETVENIGYKFINNIDKYIEAHVDAKEQLRHASKQVEEAEKEKKAERERRKQLEETINQSQGLEINIDVNQDMNVEITQETQQQIEQFINELKTNMDKNIEDTEVPTPPNELSDPDKIRDWLQSVDNILNNSEGIVSNATNLAVKCKGLLALLAI